MKKTPTIPAGLTPSQRQKYKACHFADHYATTPKAK